MESSSLKRLGTRSLAITSSAAMLVGLTAAGAAAAPAAPQAADLDAPELVSFELNTDEINFDAGETSVTVTAKITDATGVDEVTSDDDAAGPVVVAKSTTSNHSIAPVLLERTAGTNQDGTYEGTLTLPEGSADGEWEITLVTLGDTLNNDVVPADAGILDTFAVRYYQVVDLTAAYDFFQNELGTDNDSFTIPDVEGVEFYVNGTLFAPDTYEAQATGNVNIVAKAEDGYQFAEGLDEVDENDKYISEDLDYVSEDRTEASWTLDFSAATPQAVKFSDPTGGAADSYTIPDVDGVSYYLEGDVPGEDEPLTVGNHPEAVGTVTVVAVADEGFEFAEGTTTEWSHTFSTGYSYVEPGSLTITGDAEAGETLTAKTEGWGPEGVELSYQWSVDGKAVEGATESTLELPEDYDGQSVSVTVTGNLEGYESESETAIAAVADLDAATPAINGEVEVGETLEADAGDWGPEGVELAYQWNADGEAIEGATGTTLELTEENLGQRISVTVTGTLEGYHEAQRTSAVTAEVVEAGTNLTFSDVSEGQWFFVPVMWMVDNEITTGYEDGTFKPYNPVTRGEAVTFLYRYADEDFTAPDESELTDVPPTHNFFEAITWATENGVVNGYEDGSFRSGHNMTRGQVAAILYRQADPEFTAPAESPFTDLTPESNQYEAITWLAENDITTGRTNGNFDPYANVTRAELATFLQRYNEVLTK